MNDSGYRRAALKLHSLADADRAWLLGQLPDVAKRTITDMLNELGTMNLPNDRDFISHVLEEEAPATPADRALAQALSAKTLNIIRIASAEHVSNILGEEPDWVIAVILEFDHWAWTEEFLTSLSRPQRVQVCEIAKQASSNVKAKTRAALLELFAQQLKDVYSENEEKRDNTRFEQVLATELSASTN